MVLDSWQSGAHSPPPAGGVAFEMPPSSVRGHHIRRRIRICSSAEGRVSLASAAALLFALLLRVCDAALCASGAFVSAPRRSSSILKPPVFGSDVSREECRRFWSGLGGAVSSSFDAGGEGVGEKESSVASLLRRENADLRERVARLQEENNRLERRGNNYVAQRIVVENFEGRGRPMIDADGEEVHGWFEDGREYVGQETAEATATLATEECDIDDDADSCPIEPGVTFREALRDRAYWLVGLLAMQSMSGLILARNEELLQNHPIIIYFLTMLVGAGGNAGNQASVRVIRGLALGALNDSTQRQFLNRELKMAGCLSIILSFAGFVRAAVFHTPVAETIAITVSLTAIVFTSICLGAILPLLLKRIGVDPAHSSTSIQVVMDILGVVMTVLVSSLLLDSPFGKLVIERLTLFR